MNPYEGVTINHRNRRSAYLMLGVAGLAVAIALGFGINPAYLLLLAVCPLMMFFMMRHMGSMGAHEGQSDLARDQNQGRGKQRSESLH
ncbi:MAG: DUF2933 domain-containing protein [Acidimicrobiales bacterium]